MASAQTQPLKRGVEVSNKLDPDATLVRVVYTHRPGLHCDLCACVDARGLTIVRSDLRRAGRLRVHRFWVVDGRAGTKLEHAALTPLSLAVRDAVVDPGLWAKWHGAERAGRRAARDAAGETGTSDALGDGVRLPRARATLPATPRALRDALLKLLANEVDCDELDVRLISARRGATLSDATLDRGSAAANDENVGAAFFDAEASLRVGGGADAAAAARAFASGSGVVPAGLMAVATNGSFVPRPDAHGAPTTSPERGGFANEGEAAAAAGAGLLERDGFFPRRRGDAGVRSPSPYADSRGLAGETAARLTHAMPRAESIADLNRFQTTGPSAGAGPDPRGSVNAGGLGAAGSRDPPTSPAPAPASPSPLSPTPYAPRPDPALMPRSASVAEMRSRRAGHAIPHASSIADLQAMQAAAPGATTDGSPSGSRSASRLGPRAETRDDFDAEMTDANDANGAHDPQDPQDGTSVAMLASSAADDGHFAKQLLSGAAPPSLFGEGRFPALPGPRRDAAASDYRLLRELGRGLCGTVYLAEEKATRRIVAFKVMRKSKLVDVGEATHASDERRLHERVSSGPFINRLLASFQDPWALFLVLEYAPCGDLFQAMNYHGLPSRSDATVYAAQVALALGHLHALGYVYRDLKPENILLHAHGSAQLADFGMAKRLVFSDGTRAVPSRGDASSFGKRSDGDGERDSARTYTICGTAQYMSPEVLLHRGCRFEADLWALGIFVYELVTGDTPFSVASGSRQELYRKLMSHDPGSMAMPATVDASTASLVRALLRNDERERLGAGGRWGDLFAHAWFGGLNVDGVRRGSIVPALAPRRRNVVTDPALRKVLDRGNAPWRRGAVVEDAETRALFDRF